MGQARDHVPGQDGDTKGIGVVAFDRKQHRRIGDLLDKAGMNEPELEAAWHVPGRPEPCVRNSMSPSRGRGNRWWLSPAWTRRR